MRIDIVSSEVRPHLYMHDVSVVWINFRRPVNKTGAVVLVVDLTVSLYIDGRGLGFLVSVSKARSFTCKRESINILETSCIILFYTQIMTNVVINLHQ